MKKFKYIDWLDFQITKTPKLMMIIMIVIMPTLIQSCKEELVKQNLFEFIGLLWASLWLFAFWLYAMVFSFMLLIIVAKIVKWISKRC